MSHFYYDVLNCCYCGSRLFCLVRWVNYVVRFLFVVFVVAHRFGDGARERESALVDEESCCFFFNQKEAINKANEQYVKRRFSVDEKR